PTRGVRACSARDAAADPATRELLVARARLVGCGRRSWCTQARCSCHAALRQQLPERSACAKDICLDLGERDVELLGDLLVRQLLEMVEHERQALPLLQA